MAAKTLKNPYRLQSVTSISKMRKEKLKVTNSVALVMAFLAAESKNRQLSFNSKVDFILYLSRDEIKISRDE